MSGEIALDTSAAVRFLNGDAAIVERVLTLPKVTLPIVAVGELLFGAENSTRSLQNLPRYLEFISACPLGKRNSTNVCSNPTIVEAQRAANPHERCMDCCSMPRAWLGIGD